MLMLAYVDRDIRYEYFSSWRDESNKAFSLLVRIKNRLKDEGATPAEAPESEPTEAAAEPSPPEEAAS